VPSDEARRRLAAIRFIRRLSLATFSACVRMRVRRTLDPQTIATAMRSLARSYGAEKILEDEYWVGRIANALASICSSVRRPQDIVSLPPDELRKLLEPLLVALKDYGGRLGDEAFNALRTPLSPAARRFREIRRVGAEPESMTLLVMPTEVGGGARPVRAPPVAFIHYIGAVGAARDPAFPETLYSTLTKIVSLVLRGDRNARNMLTLLHVPIFDVKRSDLKALAEWLKSVAPEITRIVDEALELALEDAKA